MRRDLYLRLFLTSVFLFAFSALAVAQSGWVEGKIRDANTLEGIAGADVYVIRLMEYDTTETTTNDTGYYSVEITSNLPDTFQVAAEALGYWGSKSGMKAVMPGGTTVINLELKGPKLQNFDSSLVEDGLCEGDSSITKRVMKNIGQGRFDYSIEEGSDWLDVVPDAGQINWLREDTLFIKLYALPGNVGIFQDVIVITNNSTIPEMHIPVKLASYDADPYMDVDSSPIYDSLGAGQTSRHDRTMTNMGCQDLTFNASKDEDWLSVAPTSGTIPAEGGTRDLTIILTAPPDGGDYTGHVTIDSNDPQNPQVVIEVNMHVPESGVEDEAGNKLPKSFALRPCYPNPFNATTTIGYDLPIASQVKLEVYNLVGQKVVTLVDGRQSAGYKSITWNGTEVTTGIYYYKLTAEDFVSVRKLTILK